MPIYEWQCVECDVPFENLQSMSDPAPECPVCGGDVEKLISKSGFELKGDGWYETDYKKGK